MISRDPARAARGRANNSHAAREFKPQPGAKFRMLSEQLSSFSQEIAHLVASLKGLFGISPVLQRILISFWRTRALSAPMHATSLFPIYDRRAARSA